MESNNERHKINYKTAFYLSLALFTVCLAVFITLNYFSIKSASEIESFRKIATQTTAVPDGSDTSGIIININTAGKYELMQLPGIGEVKAQAIVDYREKYGLITELSDLLNIDGIGESTLESLAPYIIFDVKE